MIKNFLENIKNKFSIKHKQKTRKFPCFLLNLNYCFSGSISSTSVSLSVSEILESAIASNF